MDKLNSRQLIDANISFYDLYRHMPKIIVPEPEYKTVYGVPIRTAERIVELYLSNIPRIDAVEVIRCRNCKYWDNNLNYPGCEWRQDILSPDGFCDNAEPKEEPKCDS